jgi:hypothetical protein
MDITLMDTTIRTGTTGRTIGTADTDITATTVILTVIIGNKMT